MMHMTGTTRVVTDRQLAACILTQLRLVIRWIMNVDDANTALARWHAVTAAAAVFTTTVQRCGCALTLQCRRVLNWCQCLAASVHSDCWFVFTCVKLAYKYIEYYYFELSAIPRWILNRWRNTLPDCVEKFRKTIQAKCSPTCDRQTDRQTDTGP